MSRYRYIDMDIDSDIWLFQEVPFKEFRRGLRVGRFRVDMVIYGIWELKSTLCPPLSHGQNSLRGDSIGIVQGSY